MRGVVLVVVAATALGCTADGTPAGDDGAHATDTQVAAPRDDAATPPAWSGPDPVELAPAIDGAAGWRELPNPPIEARTGPELVWVDGDLVVFGGSSQIPCSDTGDCAAVFTRMLDDGARFDVAAREWSPIAPVPIEMDGVRSTAAVDGTVYVLGAVWADGPATEVVFLAYDVAADTWDQLPAPPYEVSDPIELVASDGTVVFAAVEQYLDEDLRDHRYDPRRQTFGELPPDPFVPARFRQMLDVDGQLVVIGMPEDAALQSGQTPLLVSRWDDEEAGWGRPITSWPVTTDPRGRWFAADGDLVNPALLEPLLHESQDPLGMRLDLDAEDWSWMPERPDPTLGLWEAVGDERLIVSREGWAFQPRFERWSWVGRPRGGPSVEPGATVGDGILYVVGGTRVLDGVWSLVEGAWAYDPGVPPTR